MEPTHIIYRECLPHKSLAPFIDAFWTVTGANTTDLPDRILPDGCVDIILNTGPTFLTEQRATQMGSGEQNATQMHSGEAYLVGTMTLYKEMVRPPGTRLLGIRFKPGGFSCFYDPFLLRSTADRTVLFDRSLFPFPRRADPAAPDIIDPAAPGRTIDPAASLNRFFLDRLKQPIRSLLPILADIRLQRGRLTVDKLAKQHFMTIRSLERLFDLHLAIGPKEFINFIRFQSAMEAIRHRQAMGHRCGNSLLDIACEHGYYDSAHLSNAFRKYTGFSPTAV